MDGLVRLRKRRWTIKALATFFNFRLYFRKSETVHSYSIPIGSNKKVKNCYPELQLTCMTPTCVVNKVGSTERYIQNLRTTYQRWSRGHKARGQGQGHKKKSETKAKDNLSEDRHSRGQGQECSRPRPRTKDTSANALQKKKKKSLHKNFSGDLQKKKGFHKNFSSDLHKKTFSKKFFKRSTKF